MPPTPLASFFLRLEQSNRHLSCVRRRCQGPTHLLWNGQMSIRQHFPNVFNHPLHGRFPSCCNPLLSVHVFLSISIPCLHSSARQPSCVPGPDRGSGGPLPSRSARSAMEPSGAGRKWVPPSGPPAPPRRAGTAAQRAIGQTTPLVQQGDHLIHNGDKVHSISSLPRALPVLLTS